MILTIFILIFIEYGLDYNFHKYLNPELYNNYGNHLIYNNNNYIKNIDIGKNKALESKIVICSLARNISDIFEKTKSRICMFIF